MSKDFFKRHYAIIRVIELGLDLFFVIFSFLLVVQLNKYIENGDFIKSLIDLFGHFFDTYINVLTTQLLYLVVVMMLFVVYQVTPTRKSYPDTMVSAILALFMGNMIVIVLSVMLSRVLVSPDVIGFTFLTQIVVFGVYKYLFYKIISKIDKRSVLIIGPKIEADLMATKFLMGKEHKRHLKYVIYQEQIDNTECVIDYIDKVDDVIVTDGLKEIFKNNIMTYCLSKMHKDVYLVPKLYEINIVNSKIDQIRDTPVFLSQSLHLTITQRFIKRTIDIVVSVIGLIIASPIMLVSALLIKLHDKGPVLYKQERITRNNKTFMLYKFRSMIVDAEKYTGAVWQMENDPRITKIGKFLRATRMDELPQLLNVLKGEMSLIGPRPEREIFIQEFVKSIPDFKYRVNVKPGITGLAQVLGKYNSEPVDKLRFDLIYIRNYSPWLDFKILFLTIRAVLDKDSSATLGIPKLDEVITRRELTSVPFTLGLEIKGKK